MTRNLTTIYESGLVLSGCVVNTLCVSMTRNLTTIDESGSVLSGCVVNTLCVSMTRNLTTIDESGSVLSPPSDISFDKTDEDLDGSFMTGSAKRPASPPHNDNDSDDADDGDDVDKRSRRGTVCSCFVVC